MSDTRSYDAIILGAGQAGGPLAGALAGHGWSVAFVEAEHLGGTCVNEGCTPTKTMIASARVAHLARRAADYGVRTGPVSVDLSVVRERKRSIVESFRTGSERGVARHDSVDLFMGEGRFVGPRCVRVALNEGGEVQVEAPRVFINAGTRPHVPHVPGLDGVPVLTSTSIMELGELPDHLVVIGGGYIGLEFGQMFRRFGSRVTVIQRGDQLLPREDADIVAALTEALRAEGIDVRLNSALTRVESAGAAGAAGTPGSIHLELDGPDGPDGHASLEASHVLMAAGRDPNSDRLSLDHAGIKTDERGFIEVNDRLETNAEGVWALGDINGGPAFTHIAYDDFRLIRTNLLEGGDDSREGRLVPYTLFTDPQLGRVGLSQSEAERAGIPIRVATLPMTHVARALETDETRGLLKAVVHAETDEILGCAVLSIEGGEVMTVLQMAMLGGVRWTQIRDLAIAHPTLAESLNNLFMSLGR